jgi:hypothetical protein
MSNFPATPHVYPTLRIEMLNRFSIHEMTRVAITCDGVSGFPYVLLKAGSYYGSLTSAIIDLRTNKVIHVKAKDAHAIALA